MEKRRFSREKLFIHMGFLNLVFKINESCLFIDFSSFGKCFVHDV